MSLLIYSKYPQHFPLLDSNKLTCHHPLRSKILKHNLKPANNMGKKYFIKSQTCIKRNFTLTRKSQWISETDTFKKSKWDITQGFSL